MVHLAPEVRFLYRKRVDDVVPLKLLIGVVLEQIVVVEVRTETALR